MTANEVLINLDNARDAYEALVEAWTGLKRAIRHANLQSDFYSLYGRLDAYIPDDLGDVGGGQSFNQWFDEIESAANAAIVEVD